MRLTYIGGPTALIEWDGVRLLTDPTFDPAGTTYTLPAYTLGKTQHASRILTTTAGAERLGGNAIGLEVWHTHTIETPEANPLLVTATPARHGPAHGDRGPVIGFALHRAGDGGAVYVSGDTVWFDGVDEVAKRFDVTVAILFMGAAKVRAVGDWPLTFTADEAVTVARRMPNAVIVPLHFEDWEHFTESRTEIEHRFHDADLESRLVWPRRGHAIHLFGNER